MSIVIAALVIGVIVGWSVARAYGPSTIDPAALEKAVQAVTDQHAAVIKAIADATDHFRATGGLSDYVKSATAPAVAAESTGGTKDGGGNPPT